MKYDVIIIGGGLSGLVSGIAVQEKGLSCLVISSGQNAMHFSSGSIGILSRLEDGTEVSSPLDGIHRLSEKHPYSVIGADRAAAYASAIKEFLSRAGVRANGEAAENGVMLTASGELKTASLTLEDFPVFKKDDPVFKSSFLIVNAAGYLDFNTSFIAESLERRGAVTKTALVNLPELERLRTSPSEMRSVNIAKVMDVPSVRESLINEVKSRLSGEENVILPAVFGLRDSSAVDAIRESLPAKVIFVGTMPPSVPGIRLQRTLKNRFISLGGTLLEGDTVKNAVIENGMVQSVETDNLGDEPLYAQSYILSTGSFFSKGLWATPDKIRESLMDLDVDYIPGRENWYSEKFFDSNSYLSFGVKADSSLHPSKNGVRIENLYATGSVLGGCNPIELGCGSGVAIVTALAAADEIMSHNNS